jgi:hypothetical protein
MKIVISKQIRNLAKTAAIATYKSVIKSAQTTPQSQGYTFLKSVFTDPADVVKDLGNGSFHVLVTDAQWENPVSGERLKDIVDQNATNFMMNQIKEITVSSPKHPGNAVLFKNASKTKTLQKSAQSAQDTFFNFFHNILKVKVSPGGIPGQVVISVPDHLWDTVMEEIQQNVNTIKAVGVSKIEAEGPSHPRTTVYELGKTASFSSKSFAIKAAKETYKSVLKSLVKQAQGKFPGEVLDEVLVNAGLGQLTPVTSVLGVDPVGGGKSVIEVNDGIIVFPMDPSKIAKEAAAKMIKVFRTNESKIKSEVQAQGFVVFFGGNKIQVF